MVWNYIVLHCLAQKCKRSSLFLYQLVEAVGHPSWVWFCQRFLPVKRELFLSTVVSCTLRTGDWTEEKFRCNLLVSLARQIVFELALYVWIGPIFNLINWIWLDYDYNDLDSNWLELDCTIEVPLKLHLLWFGAIQIKLNWFENS